MNDLAHQPYTNKNGTFTAYAERCRPFFCALKGYVFGGATILTLYSFTVLMSTRLLTMA